MRTTDRLTLAVAFAMLLGSASLMPLTQDRGFLVLGAATILLIEAISLAGRRLRLPGLAVHLIQALALLVIAVSLGLYSMPAGTRSLGHLVALWRDSILVVRVQVAPMAAHPGVRWLMVLLLGIVTIIADMLVVSLLSPAWILAPLLTLYLIPALALTHDVSWWIFALLGLGWLGVLLADGINENATWTRNLSDDSAEHPHSSLGAARLAAMLGIPALALSLAAGSLLPRIGDLDIQSSRPRGSGPIQMADPTLDLSKNLNLPVDRVVLTYKADQPLYLRTASLTVVDAGGWHMAPVQLTDGALPVAPGMTQPGKQVTAEVSVKDLGGEYLPAPYAPQSYDVDGHWRFDPLSLAIISTEDTNRSDAIRGKDYKVTSLLNDPGAENFTLAEVGTPPDAKTTTAVPKDVPKAITDLTSEWTKGATTPVLKAAAIQRQLTDPRVFTYSTTAPPGDGFDVLTNFLTKDHSGYCVHYASAMALMARIEGIPARVSVGFLPGTKVDDHYEVKASDMHAWPELYFKDYGWVRFEPTARIAAPPEWSIVNDQVKPLPSSSASAAGTTTKTATAKPSASTKASASTSAAPGTGTTTTPTNWAKVFGWTLGAIGIVLLMLVPALVRALTRRRRLDHAAGGLERVEGAWAEVRDTVRDLGGRWPVGTPREVHTSLADLRTEGFPDEADEAMGRLVLATERARYARSLGEVGDVADDARTVREALLQSVGRGQRLAALLAPTSLMVRLGEALSSTRHESDRLSSDDDEAPLAPGAIDRD